MTLSTLFDSPHIAPTITPINVVINVASKAIEIDVLAPAQTALNKDWPVESVPNQFLKFG